MNLRDMTLPEKEDLQRRGATWLVIVKHPQDATEMQGDLVSWHRSRDAATLAAGLSSSLQVLSLNHVDIYQDAWRGVHGTWPEVRLAAP